MEPHRIFEDNTGPECSGEGSMPQTVFGVAAEEMADRAKTMIPDCSKVEYDKFEAWWNDRDS